jgi:hypothetical protein
MLQSSVHENGRPFTRATLSKCGIYLDTHTITGLAKSDPSRQRRFAAALIAGADLLFSVTNVMEIALLEQDSAVKVRTFLDSVGPHWFPVELDPLDVVQREMQGKFWAEACSSSKFMEDFRNVQLMKSGGTILDLSADFFRLNTVMDWTHAQREPIGRGLRDMDAALITRIAQHRKKYDADPAWLDNTFPAVRFNQLRPATFTYFNLVRQLILDAKGFRLKKGDGLDFCHTVVGISFSKFATLDKHWKRRVAALPQPNGLAKVFYAPELDDFLDEIERSLRG